MNFCLSSLDQKVRAFELDTFLEAMDDLWQKGARQFKLWTARLISAPNLHCHSFIFLRTADEQTFLHFEMIPDRLHKAVKTWIQKFHTRA